MIVPMNVMMLSVLGPYCEYITSHDFLQTFFISSASNSRAQYRHYSRALARYLTTRESKQ